MSRTILALASTVSNPVRSSFATSHPGALAVIICPVVRARSMLRPMRSSTRSDFCWLSSFASFARMSISKTPIRSARSPVSSKTRPPSTVAIVSPAAHRSSIHRKVVRGCCRDSRSSFSTTRTVPAPISPALTKSAKRPSSPAARCAPVHADRPRSSTTSSTGHPCAAQNC